MYHWRKKKKEKKSFEYSGLIKEKASSSACFIFSKEHLDSGVHFTLFSFVNMLVMNFTNSTKLDINILKRFILLKKDQISFLDLVREMVLIASILFGSIFTPSVETMCRSSLSSFMEKVEFWGLRDNTCFLHFKNTFFKCWQCS